MACSKGKGGEEPYARGEGTPLRDLDLADLMRPGAEQPEQDVALYRMLSAHFGTDELTLLDLAGAGPGMAFRVLQEGKLLFCRNAQTIADLAEAVLARHPEIRRLVAEALRNDEEATVEIDRDKVLAQLRLLEADLSRLREKASIVEAVYLGDLDSQDVVMRRFQTAVETCANIGNHLIARLRLRLAEDYAGVFSVLSEAGILDRGLAARMAELARFRNLLVHLVCLTSRQRLRYASGVMRVFTASLTLATEGRTEVSDITKLVRDAIERLPVSAGVALVNTLHTTCALFVNEFQSALIDDLKRLIERLVPERAGYRHDDPRISDCERGNAHSHLRAALIGRSIALGINNGELTLGRFQSIIFAELDGPRKREISVQVIGA